MYCKPPINTYRTTILRTQIFSCNTEPMQGNTSYSICAKYSEIGIKNHRATYSHTHMQMKTCCVRELNNSCKKFINIYYMYISTICLSLYRWYFHIINIYMCACLQICMSLFNHIMFILFSGMFYSIKWKFSLLFHICTNTHIHIWCYEWVCLLLLYTMIAALNVSFCFMTPLVAFSTLTMLDKQIQKHKILHSIKLYRHFIFNSQAIQNNGLL